MNWNWLRRWWHRIDDPLAELDEGPEPPVNARLRVHDDYGTRTVPLELTYRGMHDGLHQWDAVAHVDTRNLTDGVFIADMMPGRTAVRVIVEEHDGRVEIIVRP